jgi:hypothetical protein
VREIAEAQAAAEVVRGRAGEAGQMPSQPVGQEVVAPVDRGVRGEDRAVPVVLVEAQRRPGEIRPGRDPRDL